MSELKKKILHIVSLGSMSGAERIAYNAINLLKDHYTVGIVCRDGELAQEYKKVSGHVFNNLEDGFIRKLLRYRKIIKKFQPDIIHAHDNRASVFARLVCTGKLRHTVVISHIHNTYTFIERGGILKLVDRIFRPQYDMNIFCGNKVMAYYKENTLYFDKIKNKHVLNNMTDISYNQGMAGSKDIKKPKDKVRIGFLGRLDSQKGLIEFFRELIKFPGNDTLEFYLVGTGPEEDELKKYTSVKASHFNIIYTGFKSNPYPLIASFDIVIMPSKYEGLPIALLEAMSLNKPVLAMDVGSISEVIDDGVNGWLIKTGGYDKFAAKLMELSDDTDKLKEIGLQAGKTIRDGYDTKSFSNNLRKLYSSVLKG